MPREAPQAAAWTAITLSLFLLVPPGMASLQAEPDPTPTLEETPQPEAPTPNLLTPLLHLTPARHEQLTLQTAYAAGQTWATDKLDDPADVSAAIERLYTSIDTNARPAATSVPAAFQAPLATLVTLQAHHVSNTGPHTDLTTDEAQAFTLGALTPTLETLEHIRHDAPEDPIFVDPLGLIILGGSSDNTYHSHTFATTWYKGPLLLVEPAGNDTYNVPVAGPFSFNPVRDAPIDLGFRFQIQALALELGGNDTYKDRTASADLGGHAVQALLLDRHGNDTYADTNTRRTTAHASPGFAYLLDEEGNDTYQAHSKGIAHARRAGTAILWDEQGNDTYQAHPSDGWYTHAMADSREAAAYLWDEHGNDTHSTVLGYAAAWNDAYARFVDEHGDDEYYITDHAGSFGYRFLESFRLIGDSILNRGLAEFIDGDGTDTYEWDTETDGFPLPANNKSHVIHEKDRKWGVFIDCETPDDADRPCPEQQHEARCTMARHPADRPTAADPVRTLLAPHLDQAETECQSL